MHYITLKEFPFKFKIKQRASSIEFFQTHVYIFYLLDEVLLRNFHHPVQFKAYVHGMRKSAQSKLRLSW